MSKLEIAYGNDPHGVSCVIATKKKGKISEREVFEALERKHPGMLFIHIVQIFEQIPEDYYDEGDCWFLYEPYDILPSLIHWNGGIDALPSEVVESFRKTLLER